MLVISRFLQWAGAAGERLVNNHESVILEVGLSFPVPGQDRQFHGVLCDCSSGELERIQWWDESVGEEKRWLPTQSQK